MYVAYSAIKTNITNHRAAQPGENKPEAVLRFEAYQTACEKYSREIAAIQQHMPGWVPPFCNH